MSLEDEAAFVSHPQRKFPNMTIYDNVLLGENVKIKPQSVLGGIGYGFNRDENGVLQREQHRFGVIIGDDVEIGSCCCVDQGEYRDTVIGKGTKLDNLIHVAHDVQIGKHCGFAAGVVLGGSCVIGDYSFLGLNVTVNPEVKIGRYVLIGAGSVVTKDVPDFEVWWGVPARFGKKNMFWLQKLQSLKNVQVSLTD